MAEIIKDGTGTGKTVKVDANNQMHTFSVVETEATQAAQRGNAYNLNTGVVALTGTGTSAVSYFLNDESNDFVITGIAVGIGTRSSTITDLAQITIVRNPTGGTIVSDANAMAMNSNSNFGSSNTLSSSSKAYAASATGKTLTGGTDHAILFMGDGRLFATLDMELPKGASVGVEIDLNTSGGANVYVALIGYSKDSGNV